MKSKVFDLSGIENKCEKQNDREFIWNFDVPTLSAYAVEYFALNIDGLHHFIHDSSSGKLRPGQIIGDRASVSFWFDYDQYSSYTLEIYYREIRDYSLLFPGVLNDQLRQRLGQFYEEADRAYDDALWFSFAMMCGAVFEGLLFAKLGNKNFCSLIDLALANDLIDQNGAVIMHKARVLRNLIHANRYCKPFVERVDAIEMRTLLDKLIVKLVRP
jgi:hypothetical protein